MRTSFALLSAVLIAAAVISPGTPTGAQTATEDERDVTIDYEVGDYDAERGDWPITVVNVSGELEPDEIFVVELRDGEGGVLWAGEGMFDPPTTSVTVDTFVAVGDVEEAAIGQMLPEETTTTTPTATTIEPEVAGVVTTLPPPATTAAPTTAAPADELAEPPAPRPTVEGDVVNRPDVPQSGNGFGGAGQLALSMVIAVVFVAILFRAPLPAATTTRWRK